MSPADALKLTQTDLRDLAIGVAGGLIVLAIVGFWGLARKVGPSGLLHLRRASALADLRRAESLPRGALSNLALLSHLQIVALAWFAGLVGFALAVGTILNMSGDPLRATGLRLLTGFLTGSLTASAVMVVRRANSVLFAVVNRDAYIAELREKAGLPAEPAPERRLCT